jgi:CheY-like chemotaxis protein
MARVFYVHWDKEEAAAGARGLREAGHSVRYEAEDGAAVWKELKKSRPDALVVSLAKLPSHGRRVAAATLDNKSLADIPVIFVGGEDEKVAELRKRFPLATYCSWAQLRDRIQRVTAAQREGTRPPPEKAPSRGPLRSARPAKARTA